MASAQRGISPGLPFRVLDEARRVAIVRGILEPTVSDRVIIGAVTRIPRAASRGHARLTGNQSLKARI
jgi:hypothetical protein